ncbi:MAG: hypothetical protein V2A54_11745 [Bacteroidota bacterium]
MRNRLVILKDLVCMQGNLEGLNIELAAYPWDCEELLLQVNKADVVSVLKRCLSDEIDFEELENWTNAIECRDDLNFENDDLHEIVFELANPAINGEITKERIIQIVDILSK